jgi:hypothetical protein
MIPLGSARTLSRQHRTDTLYRLHIFIRPEGQDLVGPIFSSLPTLVELIHEAVIPDRIPFEEATPDWVPLVSLPPPP